MGVGSHITKYFLFLLKQIHEMSSSLPKNLQKARKLSIRRKRKRLKRNRKNSTFSGYVLGLNPNKKYSPIDRKDIEKHRKRVLDAPTIFSLRENTEEVLKFISDIKKDIKRGRRKIFINISHVEKISNGAISMLLSLIVEYDKRASFSGNIPKEKNARKVFIKSGILEFLKSDLKEAERKSPNIILKGGQAKTDNISAAETVQDAMKVVFGKKLRNKELYSMLLEMMANCIHHASPRYQKVPWWLAFTHHHEEIENNVSFSFIDNGLGILKTLNIKIYDDFWNSLASPIEKLDKAFSGQIMSSTKEENRGRGLPSILKMWQENRISNLVVITNNVFLNFEEDKKIELKNHFKGTFYYWELKSKNNVNLKLD